MRDSMQDFRGGNGPSFSMQKVKDSGALGDERK